MVTSVTPETVFHFNAAAPLLQFTAFNVADTNVSWGVYGHTPENKSSTLIAEFAYSLQAADFAAILDGLVKRTVAIADLISDLNAHGFDDPDVPVNGADIIETLHEHLPYLRTLRTITLPPRLIQPEPDEPATRERSSKPHPDLDQKIPY